MILDGKVVVVSGVGPGLGREVAAATLRDGGRVALGARNAERLAAIAGELDPSGERVVWAAADIQDGDACAALCAAAAERFGGIDALVNCAALDTVFGGIKDVDWSTWDQTLRTNVLGSLRMTAAAVPHLEARGAGPSCSSGRSRRCGPRCRSSPTPPPRARC